MTTIRVAGVGLMAPGMPNWAAGCAVMTGDAPWVPAPVVLPPPAVLPATERRRTTPVIRLALAVAAEAAESSGLDPAALHPVFGSANGDGQTVGGILQALSDPEGFVSPTQFHNSVHNAAAGYWSIGTGSMQPVTCLGGHDCTAAAALMSAAAACAADRAPVLLCVYDAPFPAPLDAKRPTTGLFAAALVLVPDGQGPALRVEWRAERDAAASAPSPRGTEFDAMAAGNPAGRLLPVLRCLALGGGDVQLALLDGALRVGVS